MTGKTDFQARLNKLGHGSAAQKPQAPLPPIMPPKRPNHGWIYATLGGLGVAGMLAFAVLYFAQQPKYRPMASVTSAFLSEEKPQKGPSPFSPFDIAVKDKDYLASCLPFFPPAAEGWVRVTTWDATYPQAMTRLSALWAAEDKVIEEAAGYPQLQAFLNRFSGPEAKELNKEFANSISSAIYLDIANDGFVQLTLHSRPWNKSSNCRDEFLYQWDQQDPEDPPRYPVLNQFSYAVMSKTTDWMPQHLRDRGYVSISNNLRVSPGLSLFAVGVHNDRTPFKILNNEMIAERVALARAES